MVVAVGVSIMGNDWIAGEGHRREKLSIFLLCFSICLVDLATIARKTDLLFSSFARSSLFLKNWKDMMMLWIRDCCRKSGFFWGKPILLGKQSSCYSKRKTHGSNTNWCEPIDKEHMK
jgi:hypothetical protein